MQQSFQPSSTNVLAANQGMPFASRNRSSSSTMLLVEPSAGRSGSLSHLIDSPLILSPLQPMSPFELGSPSMMFQSQLSPTPPPSTELSRAQSVAGSSFASFSNVHNLPMSQRHQSAPPNPVNRRLSGDSLIIALTQPNIPKSRISEPSSSLRQLPNRSSTSSSLRPSRNDSLETHHNSNSQISAPVPNTRNSAASSTSLGQPQLTLTPLNNNFSYPISVLAESPDSESLKFYSAQSSPVTAVSPVLSKRGGSWHSPQNNFYGPTRQDSAPLNSESSIPGVHHDSSSLNRTQASTKRESDPTIFADSSGIDPPPKSPLTYMTSYSESGNEVEYTDFRESTDTSTSTSHPPTKPEVIDISSETKPLEKSTATLSPSQPSRTRSKVDSKPKPLTLTRIKTANMSLNSNPNDVRHSQTYDHVEISHGPVDHSGGSTVHGGVPGAKLLTSLSNSVKTFASQPPNVNEMMNTVGSLGKNYQDQDILNKLRLLVSSEVKFDELIEFGFPIQLGALDLELIGATQMANEVEPQQIPLTENEIHAKSNLNSSSHWPDHPAGLERIRESLDLESKRVFNRGSQKNNVEYEGQRYSMVRSSIYSTNSTALATPMSAVPREMTLKFTLTPQSMRADEAILYGWQTHSGSQGDHETVYEDANTLSSTTTRSAAIISTGDIIVTGEGMSGGPIPVRGFGKDNNTSSKKMMKRVFGKLKKGPKASGSSVMITSADAS